jgi:hypothetical protein
MFWDVPSWLLRMDLFEIAGALSYTLFFALLESLIISLPLILVGFLLPSRFSKQKYLSFCFSVLIASVAIAITLHLDASYWNKKRLLAMYWLLATVGVSFLFIKFPSLQTLLDNTTKKLGLLIQIYLGIDVLAIGILLVRNL